MSCRRKFFCDERGAGPPTGKRKGPNKESKDEVNNRAPMSETFYTSCADVLALCQAEKDNLEALLDPQTGFAPRLRQLCEQQCVPRSRHDSRVLVYSSFTDCRTFEKREMRRKRRLKR